LDDLVIASFTTGPGATTLPMRIYSEVRLGVKPEINAICTILIGVVALAIFAAAWIARRAGEGETAGLPAKGCSRPIVRRKGPTRWPARSAARRDARR